MLLRQYSVNLHLLVEFTKLHTQSGLLNIVNNGGKEAKNISREA